MAAAFIIDISGIPAGIVEPSGAGFRFHASGVTLKSLDGKRFKSVENVRQLAQQALAKRWQGRIEPPNIELRKLS
jgi:hypothetical protein